MARMNLNLARLDDLTTEDLMALIRVEVLTASDAEAVVDDLKVIRDRAADENPRHLLSRGANTMTVADDQPKLALQRCSDYLIGRHRDGYAALDAYVTELVNARPARGAARRQQVIDGAIDALAAAGADPQYVSEALVARAGSPAYNVGA